MCHRSQKAITGLAVFGSVALFACTQQTDIPAVASTDSKLSFSANIADGGELAPTSLDLCWVNDNDISMIDGAAGTSLTDALLYEAEKASYQATIEEWRENTGLTFNWRATCRPPAQDSLGRLTFLADEVRIYLDAAPTRAAEDRLPGANCLPTSTFGDRNWSRFSWEAKTAAQFCEVSMKLFYGMSRATVLHEMGHALGLDHEHARVDTPDECRDYGGDNATTVRENFTIAPATPLAIPDGNAAGLSRSVLTVRPIDADGIVYRVRVYATVDHPRHSDLVIKVVGPDGTTATVHNRGSEVQQVWDSATNAALQAFSGKLVDGYWKIVVSDVAAGQSGTLSYWKVILNGVSDTSDTIFATAYDPDSVMHYTLHGCPVPGVDTEMGLSDADHLAAEMAYPTGNIPVYGEGVYRDDVPIKLQSAWVARGALIGDELNEGFLSNFAWSIVRFPSGTPVLTSSSTGISYGPLAAGTYIVSFSVDDFWNRSAQHTGQIVVMTKAAHTAMLVAALL